MKREKGAHGYYRKWRKRVKENSYLVGGRVFANMGYFKYCEYHKLLWYLHTDDVIPYGWSIVLYRFYKNRKYRKRYISLVKKMESKKIAD